VTLAPNPPADFAAGKPNAAVARQLGVTITTAEFTQAFVAIESIPVC
jgi:hypothetical protein